MTRPLAEMAATAGDDPSPRQAWQEVIGLAVGMIVAAFVPGLRRGQDRMSGEVEALTAAVDDAIFGDERLPGAALGAYVRDRLMAAGWQLTRVGDEERLRALSEAATPGPWKARTGHPADTFEPDGYKYVQFGPTEAKATGLGTDQLKPADADLIAAAVNYVRERLAPQPPSPASQGEER